MKTITKSSKNPWIYFTLALGISWFFWSWIIVFQLELWSALGVFLGALGLFGPFLAELYLVYRQHDQEEQKDYWKRILDYKRISLGWYAIIFGMIPLFNLFILTLDYLISQSKPAFPMVHELISKPWMILPYMVFILFFGPVPEELGWRGYALDALQSRFNALHSSMILGLLWSLWHVPLFFMKGTFQHDYLRFGTMDFWMYLTGPFITSIIFTWIYNNTNRSTLSAILFHFTINFSGELILPKPSLQARFYSLGLLLLTVILVTWYYGPTTLTKINQEVSKE